MTNTILSNGQADNLFKLAKVSVSCFVHKKYPKYFNELDIEDFVSDTVFKALRYWSSFNPDKANLGTWVSRIARSVVLDGLDYRNKRLDINLDMYPMCAERDNRVDHSLVIGAGEMPFYRGDEYETDRNIRTEEFLESVKKHESVLSERDRGIWEMLKDGLKPREISWRTGMSANAVSIRKYYIMETMRPKMVELAREYDIRVNNVA